MNWRLSWLLQLIQSLLEVIITAGCRLLASNDYILHKVAEETLSHVNISIQLALNLKLVIRRENAAAK